MWCVCLPSEPGTTLTREGGFSLRVSWDFLFDGSSSRCWGSGFATILPLLGDPRLWSLEPRALPPPRCHQRICYSF
jgi:hypothetical protein